MTIETLTDEERYQLRESQYEESRKALRCIDQRDAEIARLQRQVLLQADAPSLVAEVARLTEALAAAEKSRLEWRADVIEWRARAEAAEQKLAAAETKLRQAPLRRLQVSEAELIQLRERVAKVKIAIGHTWTAEGMREAVEEALRAPK